MPLSQDLKKKHDFDSPRQEAFLNLARTQAELSGPFVALFKQHGITMASYNVLRILRGVRKFPEDGHDALPCSEIVDRLVARVPDLTRLIDRLVEKGLVERQRGAEDRRVVRARISTAGLRLLNRLDQPVAELHENSFQNLTARELDELNRLLAKAR